VTGAASRLSERLLAVVGRFLAPGEAAMFPLGVVEAIAARAAPWLLLGPTTESCVAVDWHAWAPDHVRWVQEVVGRCPLSPTAWHEVFLHDPDLLFLLRVATFQLRVVGGSGDAAAGSCPGPLVGGARLPIIRGHNIIKGAAAQAAVEADVAEGLRTHRLVAPPPGLSSRVIHPLMVVPKGLTGFRVVHNLSYGNPSLNDFTCYIRFRWASVDDALQLMTPGCYFARVDVASYYRHFPLHPADWSLQAFVWAGRELWDPYVQFGFRPAVEIGHRVSQAIGRVFRICHGHLVVIMDDMLLVRPLFAACERDFTALCRLLTRLGFTLSDKAEKTHGGQQWARFVGLRLDSTTMTVSLDADKLVKTATAVESFRHRASCSITELQSLLGLLHYVSQVVYGGRTFLHRMLEVMRSADHGGLHSALAPTVTLDTGFHEDLAWWGENLIGMNGKRRILDTTGWASTTFATDADEGTGVGVFFNAERHGGWTFAACGARYPQLGPPLAADSSVRIHIKELLAVLVAVTEFPDLVANCLVVVRTDSQLVEAAINSGASRALDPSMMGYMRQLFSASVRLNFRLVARFVPGLDNGLADSLSRQQWDRFAALKAEWVARYQHPARPTTSHAPPPILPVSAA